MFILTFCAKVSHLLLVGFVVASRLLSGAKDHSFPEGKNVRSWIMFSFC